MQFRDVIGHTTLKRMLARSADEGRISHAQLFTGEAGCGALPLALAYAQYINCTNRHDGDSCGECPSCRKMAELAHPDLNFVFPVNSPKGKSGSEKPLSDYFIAPWRELVKQTGGYFDEPRWYEAINIENQQGIISRAEADEIIRKLSFKSFEAEYKVMVIWLPEKMRTEAANTLLKILEEPWEKTLFLMVSESPARLLSTIVSRTQEVVVPRIELPDLERHLIQKYGMESAQATTIARLSGGNVLEAARLAEGSRNGTSEEYFDLFVQLMRLSYNDRHMELLEWAETVAALGREEQKRFLQNSIRLLRNSYMLHAGMGEIAYLWGDELAFCKKFAPFIGNHNIEALVREMELAAAQVAQNGNPKLIFAHFALTVSKLIVRL